MIDVVLTDVEGTTSALAFVTQKLFPFARARLHSFIERNADEPYVRSAHDDARSISGEPLTTPADFAMLLERWTDEDRKLAPLKDIQGFIWESAFRSGQLRAHVYADVPVTLREWRARGVRLAVFSSGSERAQRTFFAHTEAGDLGALFEAHFDTRVGSKRASGSYAAIASQLRARPERVLFLSDVPEELDAAEAAGMHAIGIARDGSTALRNRFGAVATRFDEVEIGSVRVREDATLGAALARLVRRCYEGGLVWATSGNFSVRLAPELIAITASGLEKGSVTASDLLFVDTEGRLVTPTDRRPSAEMPLHCALYRRDPTIGAVAHTHSVAATVLSRRHATDGELVLSGYEMQKALGLASHETKIVLPILPNDQDTVALAHAAEARSPSFGYLVEGHGLTTWARDPSSLQRHVEALEFLLACALNG